MMGKRLGKFGNSPQGIDFIVGVAEGMSLELRCADACWRP